MQNPGEDISAQKASQQLFQCGKSLQDVTGAMHEMLDGIIVASGCTQKSDVLMAWNNGLDRVSECRALAVDIYTETEDFMNTDEFPQLDGTKRADYWETCRMTGEKIRIIDKRHSFYLLLSKIEHTEQMIGFLWQNLKSHGDKVLARQINGTLAERGLSRHKKQLTNVRNRLRYEIGNIMKLITRAVNHSHFSSITNEKQKEYQAKWKAYAAQLGEIDVD